LAPFEALCAKKPVIVSSELTAANIIKKERVGIVTKDYAKAILDIYNNPDKYHESGKRGEKYVRENLSWDRFCKGMVDVFYKATNNKV
jgi:glycosyltransferase involved in cell wall biosynthesis